MPGLSAPIPQSRIPGREEVISIAELRAVFFDLGGTLAYPSPSFHGLLAKICQQHGLAVSAEEAARAEPAVWAKIGEREDEARGFTLTPERSRAFWFWVYRTFLTELGQQPKDGVLEALLHAFSRPAAYQLYEDVLPTLGALHQSSLSLGIISNWEAWADDLLEELRIRPYFHCTLISGSTGYEKPDPEIFVRALAAAGVAPEEAIHVGDDPVRDVEAAEQVGMRAVLLDRSGRSRVVPPEAFGTAPRPGGSQTRQIRSLQELPALLAAEQAW